MINNFYDILQVWIRSNITNFLKFIIKGITITYDEFGISRVIINFYICNFVSLKKISIKFLLIATTYENIYSDANLLYFITRKYVNVDKCLNRIISTYRYEKYLYKEQS